jgi:hypothetical protein
LTTLAVSTYRIAIVTNAVTNATPMKSPRLMSWVAGAFQFWGKEVEKSGQLL